MVKKSEMVRQDLEARLNESEKSCQETKEKLTKLEKIQEFIFELSSGKKKLFEEKWCTQNGTIEGDIEIIEIHRSVLVEPTFATSEIHVSSLQYAFVCCLDCSVESTRARNGFSV